MKKIILLILSVYSTSSFAQTTFQVRFKNTLSQSPGKMIITTDEGVIITANEPDSVKTTKVFYSKVKKNGKVEWSNVYGAYEKTLNTKSLIPTKNNGFVACLQSFDSLLKQEIFIIKADSSGNILWQKKFEPISIQSRSLYISGILGESQDGGFYYLQQNSNYYPGHLPIYYTLMKFDINGTLVWSSDFKITPSSDYGSYIENLTETSDKGIVLAVHTISCEAYCKTLYFIKFKADGRPEWRYGLGAYIYSYDTPVQLLNEDENKNINFILEGGIDKTANVYTYVFLNTKTGNARTYTINRTIFDLQNFIRKKNVVTVKGKVLNSFPGYNSQSYSFRNIYGFTNDFGFFNGSSAELMDDKQNILLEKYNSFGSICPDYIVPEITDSVTKGNLVLSKSSFHLSEPRKIIMQNVNDIITTPSNARIESCTGKAPETITSINKENLQSSKTAFTSLRLTPNPATDHFNISYNATNTQQVKLQVIDVNGKVLKTKNLLLQKGINIISENVSSIASGIYFVQIKSADDIKTLKFIKQ